MSRGETEIRGTNRFVTIVENGADKFREALANLGLDNRVKNKRGSPGKRTDILTLSF